MTEIPDEIDDPRINERLRDVPTPIAVSSSSRRELDPTGKRGHQQLIINHRLQPLPNARQIAVVGVGCNGPETFICEAGLQKRVITHASFCQFDCL